MAFFTVFLRHFLNTKPSVTPNFPGENEPCLYCLFTEAHQKHLLSLWVNPKIVSKNLYLPKTAIKLKRQGKGR